MTLNTYISNLGKHFNINSLVLSHSGSLTLNIKDRFLLHINKLTDTEFFLNLNINEMSSDGAESNALDLLNINISLMTSSGGYLYWNAKDCVLSISKSIDISMTSELECAFIIGQLITDAHMILDKIVYFN
ncbi:CesT family type III secretion system chaperone [Enterobacter hormaechei]